MTGALFDDDVLVASGRRRRVDAGQSIFRVGDAVEVMHVLCDGVALVRSTTVDGDPAVVDVRSRGDLLDDTALLASGPPLHLDEIKALTPCVVLVVSRSVLDERRDHDPSVGAELVAQLTAQARRLSSALVDALGRPARARAARRLVDLADALSRSGLEGAPLTVTQHDLAQYTATTRSTLNALLGEFQDAGAVTVGRGRIVIDDPGALARFC